MPGLPLSGQAVLDRYFLETRCKLIEIAANLDRIDRGGGLGDDPRREKLDAALAILATSGPDRAERLQVLFSRDYDPQWLDNFEGADILRG